MKRPRTFILLIALAALSEIGLCHDSTRPDENAKEGGPTGASDQVCKLKIELLDAASAESIPGMIRLLNEAGTPVGIPELLDRCIGLPRGARKLGWHVLLESTEISAPREKLTVEAVSGLEYVRLMETLDLAGQEEQSCQLPLTRFWNAKERGLVAGNTHLHLKDLSREEADRYLQEVSRADGLEVVFVSYLERAVVDRTYVTNQHSRDDLEQLSLKHLRFGNGQEYRHNFGGGGEGYGHVLFLDLRERILPGSIGPGITGIGTDGTPLQSGIKQANDQEATVVWCHNGFGFEDIPNWVEGLVQAQNIFDGGNRGSYEDTFYRYLNLGIRLPFSTGTDWFLYDYSRVYTRMEDEEVTASRWLGSFRNGRTFITNGPLLEMNVNGVFPGEELSAENSVKVQYRAVSRENFGKLELIQNGNVTSLSNPVGKKPGGWYESAGTIELPIQGASWVALRISPATSAKNEFGRQLFAHTSPVYVNTTAGEVIDPEVVVGLLEEIKADLSAIREEGTFGSEEERKSVEQIYEEAIRKLRLRKKP
ncbi:MAG: CehA/McbA family metallohydrolase [Verrucomicrobiales bacterium]|nr:CehA/McbA family metallohydrolase [Verrucomicrobiales bacterium]